MLGPRWGDSAPPDPIADFKGGLLRGALRLRGGEGKEKEGEGRGREGKGKDERGREGGEGEEGSWNRAADW